MNKNHRVTILALSLSVLTLAAISTLLSLSQSGVLGVTTVGVGRSAPAPTTILARPTVSSGPTMPEKTGVIPCAAFNTLLSLATSTNPLYSQLLYLSKNFCSSNGPITSPQPTSVSCKTGINTYTNGKPCTFASLSTESAPSFNNAKVVCYDGSSTIVGDSTGKICYQGSTLEALARKFCDNKSLCQKPSTTIQPIPITKRPEPTKPTSITGSQTLTCGWCGSTCTFIKPGMMCPMIAAPADQQCVLSGNSCKTLFSTPIQN